MKSENKREECEHVWDNISDFLVNGKLMTNVKFCPKCFTIQCRAELLAEEITLNVGFITE